MDHIQTQQEQAPFWEAIVEIVAEGKDTFAREWVQAPDREQAVQEMLVICARCNWTPRGDLLLTQSTAKVREDLVVGKALKIGRKPLWDRLADAQAVRSEDLVKLA